MSHEQTIEQRAQGLFVVGDESTAPGHIWWVVRMVGVAVFGSTDEAAADRERDRLYAEVLRVLR